MRTSLAFPYSFFMLFVRTFFFMFVSKRPSQPTERLPKCYKILRHLSPERVRLMSDILDLELAFYSAHTLKKRKLETLERNRALQK